MKDDTHVKGARPPRYKELLLHLLVCVVIMAEGWTTRSNRLFYQTRQAHVDAFVVRAEGLERPALPQMNNPTAWLLPEFGRTTLQ